MKQTLKKSGLKKSGITLALTLFLSVSSIVFEAQAAKPVTVYQGSTVYVRELKSADQWMQTGRFKEAEQRYSVLLKKTPNDPLLRSAMAFAQAESYKLDAAEKNAKMVLNGKSVKSKDVQARAIATMTLGIVARNRSASQDMTYRSQRDTLLNASANYLESASRLNPKSAEIWNQLGVTYRYQNRMTDAASAFDRANEIDPTYGEALLNLGLMRFDAGDTTSAKQYYQQAISRNSKNYMAHYRLGEAFIKEGNMHLGLKSLNTALALNPGNASVMTKMAEAYTQQGNNAGAVSFYRKAILANPTFMPAYSGLSNLFDRRGDGELAMAELKSALNVNPKYAAGRNQLGRLALVVDKPDQAVQAFRESLNQNPADVEAVEGLSQALTQIAQKTVSTSESMGSTSDLADAEAAVQEALRLSPNNLKLHLASLRISKLSGKPTASKVELERIVQQPVQSRSDRLIQGQALFALGRIQESDALFTALLQESQNDSAALLTLGDTLKVNGDLKLAKEAYQRVEQVQPNSVKAQRGIQRIEAAEQDAQKSLRLANALNNIIQKKSSLDFYEESLEKNPRQPDAWLKVAKLYENSKQYARAANAYQFYLGLSPQLQPKEKNKYQQKIQKLTDLAEAR